MTKSMEKAISKLRELPDERQDALADYILDLAGEPSYRLTDEQLAEVDLALEEADEGKFATDAQVAALWKKFGL